MSMLGVRKKVKKLFAVLRCVYVPSCEGVLQGLYVPRHDATRDREWRSGIISL